MTKALLILLGLIVLTNSPFSQYDLQKMINTAHDGDTIILKKGLYAAVPSVYEEDQCGNCLIGGTKVYGTMGFMVKGKSIAIIGESKEEVILKTNAGYGLVFQDSPNSFISNLTIGGGIRDSSGNATNAGIVLKSSKVTIKNCIISNDTVRKGPLPIVGVSGIVIREGSEGIITNNLIYNNTWDGIALYRGAKATIIDNVIQNGRGAGIGITWDAAAIVIRNRVSGFWKGIGTFGRSTALVKNNEVFDNLGWGIVITGNSNMVCENNVITRNGNCGIAPWCDSTETGTAVITNNIITENGWRREWVCPQVGYWMNANPERFSFRFNDVWNNSAGDYRDIENQTAINGNISVDPLFESKFDFSLKTGSAALNSGDPSILNPDGSQSHIGSRGGPNAFR